MIIMLNKLKEWYNYELNQVIYSSSKTIFIKIVDEKYITIFLGCRDQLFISTGYSLFTSYLEVRPDCIIETGIAHGGSEFYHQC